MPGQLIVVAFQSTIRRQPTRELSGALRHSASLRVGFVKRILDRSHALLGLAFDLLRHALQLLIRVAGCLADSLLESAGKILDASFNLVLVHSNLRNRCMLLALLLPRSS